MKVLAIITDRCAYAPHPPHICIIRTMGIRPHPVNPKHMWSIRKYGYTKGEAIKKAINRYISAIKLKVIQNRRLKK